MGRETTRCRRLCKQPEECTHRPPTICGPTSDWMQAGLRPCARSSPTMCVPASQSVRAGQNRCQSASDLVRDGLRPAALRPPTRCEPILPQRQTPSRSRFTEFPGVTFPIPSLSRLFARLQSHNLVATRKVTRASSLCRAEHSLEGLCHISLTASRRAHGQSGSCSRRWWRGLRR